MSEKAGQPANGARRGGTEIQNHRLTALGFREITVRLPPKSLMSFQEIKAKH